MKFWRNTWWIRVRHSEFWPMWMYYLPVWVQHVFLAARCRNPFFFLRTNPGIDGFILSDSKSRTLGLVPPEHRPAGFLIPVGTPADAVLERMRENGIGFPVILKPDIGFRGLRVSRVPSAEVLAEKLAGAPLDLLLQEYVAGELELGIFYSRLPGAVFGQVSSVTRKDFLRVVGDGQHTLGELVGGHWRARMHAGRLREEVGARWDRVPGAGEVVRLGWIGNHNLGTRFLDGSALIEPGLTAQINRMALRMEGFYFGRFDLRAESLEALREGRFKILEVNGVGAEPTHMYDPSIGYFRAVRDLCRVWRVAARIARLNMAAAGSRPPSYREARRLWDRYRTYRGRLFAT